MAADNEWSVSRVLDTIYGKFEPEDENHRDYCMKAARHGTLTHRIIEETLSIEDSEAFNSAVDSKAHKAYEEEDSYYWISYAAMAKEARAWMSRRKATLVSTELKVSYTFGDIELHGVIDAVVRIKTRDALGTRYRTVIVDWKTSRSTLSHSRYVCQCEFYALLYGEQNNIPLHDLRYAVVYLYKPPGYKEQGEFNKKSCVQQIRRTKKQLIAYLETLG